MSFTESHIVQLSSANADVKKNGSAYSYVEFSFPGLLKRTPDVLQAEVSILHAQLPNSLYSTNATNNILRFSVDTGAQLNLTIPLGNYNATTLLAAIKQGLDVTYGYDTFTFAFSQITGKITISNIQNFTLYPTANSILPTLGFAKDTTYASVGLTLTAPYPLNTIGALNLQVASTLLQTKNYNAISSGTTTLLATIPIDAMTWGIISYHNTTNIRNTLYSHKLDAIDIQIYDNTGNLVDFNGQDWEITLVLDITRKQPDVQTQMFSKFIDTLPTLPKQDAPKQETQPPQLVYPNIATDPEPALQIEDMEYFLLSQ